jgi:competence protein ComEC
VWEAVPVPRNPELRALRDRARLGAAAWRTLQAGDRLAVGDAVIEVLHPPLPEWERQKVRNDDSLVLRLVYGHVEFLLTGDAGHEFELADAIDSRMPIRILKVGHHGSRTSTSGLLVDALRPDIALVSAGRGNLFGHPAPDVVRRLERAGAVIFRTDRDAAIILETDGTRVAVSSLRGRTFEVVATRRSAPGQRPQADGQSRLWE